MSDGFFSSIKTPSLSTILIGCFVAIFAVFLFSNTSVILSKLGFETATTLKAELTKSQAELTRAKEVNTQLTEELKKTKELYEQTQKAVTELNKETVKVQKQTDEIQKTRTEKKKQTVNDLEKKTVTTDTTITIPIEEYNTLSAANIDSIHSAFETLQKGA